MGENEKIRVLWFANTPCGATAKLTGKSVTGGGWLYALSEQVAKEPSINLHIAFYWGTATPAFEHNGITYHPVLRNGEGNRWGRMINRYRKAHGDTLTKVELPRLMKVVREVKPDLIHIHGSEENFGLIAKERLSCPIVLSIQGILSPILGAYYRGFPKSSIQKTESLLYKLMCSGVDMSEKSMARRAALEREAFRYIPNIIGRTFWDKACSLSLNPSRKYYVVDEILRAEFYGVKWNRNTPSDSFILCSTISNGWYKGVESIFKTAKLLVDVGFRFQWNVIGSNLSDPPVCLAEKICGKKSSELQINLLGRKEAPEIVDILLNSDTFVQVSHIENSPNSLCEAMLIGMPCIATFAGGTASMLENNVEGRLVQDGDAYALAGMVMEMAADFDQARVFGKMAAKRAAERHNPEHVCQQIMNVYNGILNQ